VRGGPKSPDLLLRQGEILMGGALLHVLLVAGFTGRTWTPLIVAGVLVLGAAAGGEARDPLGLVAVPLAVWGVLALAGVAGVAGEAGLWTIGLGLAGALHVLFALNPGGRGEI
jgi:hypothetical protein